MENLANIKADGIYLIKGSDLIDLARTLLNEAVNINSDKENREGVYTPISKIKGLDARIYNALNQGGCKTIKDIFDLGDKIKRYNGVGLGSVRKLKECLHEMGYEIHYRGL